MLSGINQEDIITINPRVAINARGTPSVSTVTDTFSLPASAAITILKLVEIPYSEYAISAVELPGGSIYTNVAFPPSAGQFSIDTDTYNFGVIAIGPGSLRTMQVTYKGLGTLVSAQDFNELSAGTAMATDFVLPLNATVPGNLVVGGDLQLSGGVDKITTLMDTLVLRDVQLIINLDGSDLIVNEPAGFYVSRKSSGTSTPGLKWIEKGDASPLSGWSLTNEDGDEQLSLSNYGNLAIAGLFSPATGVKFAPMADSAVAATSGNEGRVYLSSDDNQFKAIVSNGVGGYNRIILG
jgi:hypothetical protein